jgi:outer membrane receptor protein involved in Fe transport
MTLAPKSPYGGCSQEHYHDSTDSMPIFQTAPIGRLIVPIVLACVSPAVAFAQDGPADLSLDSLLQVRITTASKHWELVTDAPASVSVVTTEDISRYGYRTLDEVLSSVPGFYTNYDRNYAYAGVRGFGRPTDYNDRILLLLNGHTMNEPFYGSAMLGTDFALDLGVVERIEIVRGPGSALYGSGAMLAVVNVITRQGKYSDFLRVTGSLGSYGRRTAGIAAGKAFGADLEGMGSFRWMERDGQNLYYSEYDTDSTNDGIAQGLDWDRSVGAFGSVRYKNLKFQGAFFSRSKGIPTGAYGTTFNDNRTRTTDRYGMAEVRLDQPLAPPVSAMARAYFDRYDYNGTFPSPDLLYDATTASRLGGELQIQWDSGPRNRVIAGMEHVDNLRGDYRYWSSDTMFFRGDFPFRTTAFYVEDEFQLTDDIGLTLGVRHEVHSATASSTAPRAALIFHPSLDASIKLLYGEAYRAPNSYERYYEDPINGFKSNHSVEGERISTLELLCEKRVSDWLYASSSAYAYRMRGLIDQVIDPADSLLHFTNISPVRAAGLEMRIVVALDHSVRGYANYTYEHATDEYSEATLTNVPVHLFRAGMSLDPWQAIRFGIEERYESGRETIRGTRTDSYFLTNVSSAYTFSDPSRWDGKVRLSLVVRNIFDARYAYPAGFEHLQASIPQDGRTWIGKIEVIY